MKAIAARNRLREIATAMACVVPGILLNYLGTLYAFFAMRLVGVPTDRAARLGQMP